MKTKQFSRMLPGVWKATIGTGDAFSPLSLLEQKIPPRTSSSLPSCDPPSSLREGMVVERVGVRTVVRFPLAPEERLFGCGLQFFSVNQRGKTRFLRVNSDPKQDTGETHAPVPWYVSSKGYGILFDTSRIVTLHLGSTVRADSLHPPVCRSSSDDPDWVATMPSDVVEAVITGEGLQVYLFGGPDMLSVVRRYNLLCGGGPLPPLWTLGFWHRVPSLSTQEEVDAEIGQFREGGYPVDVVGLEPGWHSTNYPDSYLWNPRRFHDPAQFMQAMKKRHVQVNLWEHAWVSPESPIHAALVPLSGSHTVWGGLAPDFSLKEAQQLFQSLHISQHLSLGVSGYKLDECDGSELTDCSWMFPAQATFPSGHDGEQMRQNYGLLYQWCIANMFHARNTRTFGLVRASGTGASSLPFVLYSDLYDHHQYITALCNSAFSGLLWTPEVRRAKTSEEWVRRMQTVLLSPLALLNAWGDKTKPWTFPDVAPIIKKYMRLRMRLLPYLYTTYAQYHYEGIPVIRSMELACGDIVGTSSRQGIHEFDTEKAPYGRVREFEFNDQYFLGDSLLVAPLFAGETQRSVYLPNGTWFGLESHQEFHGGQFVSVKAGLETIPVFVKSGTLLPLIQPFDHVPDGPVPITVVPYGDTEGATTCLYEDDGTSFAYEQGDDQWITVSCMHGKLSVTRQGKPLLWDTIQWEMERKS
jgi:alpha-D-xyloside xylohydrolase